MLQAKRIFEPAAKEDGYRILVDRIWPRGLAKDAARLDAWWKGLAPSTELRKWFDHDPERWLEFQKRFRKELDQRAATELDESAPPGRSAFQHAAAELKQLQKKGNRVTLLFAAKETRYNNAVALVQFFGDAGKTR